MKSDIEIGVKLCCDISAHERVMENGFDGWNFFITFVG